MLLLLAAIGLIASSRPVSAAHQMGDFIHTARKAQLGSQRTNWHDLLGHHCPRFGQSRTVAIPLHRPLHLARPLKDYKLQLSFDGDKFVTPWLPMLGKRAPPIPYVEVTLRRSGDELVGVSAKVMEMPDHVLGSANRQQLASEFQDVSHWPKHVVVHYRFVADHELRMDLSLYMLFALGLTSAAILAFSALAGVQQKLAEFVAEVAADDTPAQANDLWKGAAPKAE